jgi:hypothetical protein
MNFERNCVRKLKFGALEEDFLTVQFLDLALKRQEGAQALIGAIFKKFGSDVGSRAQISALKRQRQLKGLSSLPYILGWRSSASCGTPASQKRNG